MMAQTRPSPRSCGTARQEVWPRHRRVRGGLLGRGQGSFAHEMRNEPVEELIVDPEAKAMQKRTGSPEDPAKAAGWRAKQAEEGKKEKSARKSGQEAPPGEASLSEKRAYTSCQGCAMSSPNQARQQRLLGRRTI